ncbi:predicted protein [Naegleria gruberi]|uniref:Phospholipase B-like n=1 Tax=Naegleria gruberi TaxID=5762 RepID=D2VZZ3_NAEGR|nr:uncharacterized protein NAEGRDRAFT_53618 [Naegleria gruberi]EFC37614.1 predicted protein [Naegleria gruberi]|eukprot:XP_002670358.1 predicted protein [Naegleria gruberi strain NEG-M]
MMKTYTLNFANPLTKSRTVTFSSYPGSLGSNDDYYQTDGGLVVIETTIGILNNTLYDNTHPQSLLSWFRVVLANRMATSGREWFEVFSINNGGTYNNEWMILDVKKFIPGQAQLTKDLFWVIEQIPGTVVGSDQTNLLSTRGYFASYNVPFYPSIYEKTGYAEYVKKFPETYHYMSYDKCARSEIFRRDQHLVKDLPSMQRIMQYDNYHDEFSFGNPDWVISARDDLAPNVPNGQKSCGGGYDCKISSISKWNFVFFRSGPAHQFTPVFKFENQCGPQYSHVGLPLEWNFPWIQLDSRV